MNKTALDLACEYIEKHNCLCNESMCPAGNDCNIKDSNKQSTHKQCIRNFIKHFKEQADIPDGGDVMKEIYGHSQTRMNNGYEAEESYNCSSDYIQGNINAYETIIKELRDKLKQAGIEGD